MRGYLLVMSLLLSGQVHSSGMAFISAGEFLMGCAQADPSCDPDEGKAGGMRVYVPDFYIDRHEVNVAEYRACVKAGQCRLPKLHSRNQYCNYDAPGRDLHPVNCIDWQDALSYCQAQGKRLPLEAEWEKAARAGSESAYLWKMPPTCKQAILNDGMTTGSAPGEWDGCGEDRTWAVGTRPANAYGLYDMFGNVSEWVQNWYQIDVLHLYAKGNLRAPSNGQRKVIRGGAWDESQRALRNASRYAKPPRSGRSVWGSNGFRCAKD